MNFVFKNSVMAAFLVFISSTVNAENLPTNLETENTLQNVQVENNLGKFQAEKNSEELIVRDEIEVDPESGKVKLYGSFTTRKYIVGPNDIINVSLLGIPQLSQDSVKVQPDGKIDLAGLGNIKVAGFTIEEVSDQLNEKYAYYVKNPNVSVNLKRSRPFIIQVTGAVSTPGSYEINTDTENGNSLYNNNSTFVERKTPILSNVLIAAGGINYDADLEHIMISNSIEEVEYEINALALLEKNKSAQDIYLMAGDSVHVPRLVTPLAVDEAKYKKFANAAFSNRVVPVRVLGYVNTPGLVNLNTSVSSTLNTAISEAGGYQSSSAYPPKKVFVSRIGNDGNMVTTVVNPMKNDMTLMPNDVVYVPDKVKPLVGKVFDYMARVIAPFSSVASGYNNWSLIFDPTRFVEN